MANNLSILFICLEFMKWQQARSWCFQSGIGLHEALAASGVQCLTVPALNELNPSDLGHWFRHLRQLCNGKQFDQVWFEVVHSKLDEDVLGFISTLAPVRLGIIGETLYYPAEIYTGNPYLWKRKKTVERRLKFTTHVLAADECDAQKVKAQGPVKALWWVQSIAEKLIPPSLPNATSTKAFFSGTIYGEREKWLSNPLLRELLGKKRPQEDDTNLPEKFNQLNEQIVAELRSGDNDCVRNILNSHVDKLCDLRKMSFLSWINELANGCAVVNLPGLYQGYASRISEGMAAGRPVISWDIPNRPRTKALFDNGKEILLYSKDNPQQLADHIHNIRKNPDFSLWIAKNARKKLLEYHTLEHRIAQIIEWIETGIEPDFGENPDVLQDEKNNNTPINTFTNFQLPPFWPVRKARKLTQYFKHIYGRL